MIKVQGLTKRYARNMAVDHISFEVQKGQIVGFLGPNGAGKTTTMRMLTCFIPPTDGSAEVAGYDVVANSMEVKRRIGYLPETPPVYPDMEVVEYLDFVGRIKGVPTNGLGKRISEVMEKCAVTDVRNKQIGKLSKGYRQRVGLAQAILHNPDVLILDEPTSGLDPHQIIETRDLIKGLAGEHTIILSTHILPEVEATCEHVVIIAKGKLVATDTVEHLTSRLRGSETVALEVMPKDSSADLAVFGAGVRQKLEQVAGVSRVVQKDTKDGRAHFTIESLQGRQIRPELARAVVESGWQLNELHGMGLSLEEVFLELTASKDGSGEKENALTNTDVVETAARDEAASEEASK
jgi:ABC-2 type transport system ATP-binding protein